MKKQRLHELEASLRQFDGTYFGKRLSPTPIERSIESQVHELAHASVFRINALKAPRKKRATLSDLVASRFRTYDSPVYSDLSECKALAVELFVTKKLGIRISYKGLILGAQQNMLFFARWQAFRAVEKELEAPINKRRAKQVLCWIRVILREWRETRREHGKAEAA